MENTDDGLTGTTERYNAHFTPPFVQTEGFKCGGVVRSYSASSDRTRTSTMNRLRVSFATSPLIYGKLEWNTFRIGKTGAPLYKFTRVPIPGFFRPQAPRSDVRTYCFLLYFPSLMFSSRRSHSKTTCFAYHFHLSLVYPLHDVITIFDCPCI